MDADHIAKQFFDTLKIDKIEPYGNGLINDTYCLEVQSKRYILQKINSAVFPHPEQIISNHLKLIQHLQSKPKAEIKLKIPDLKSTQKNKFYYQDSNQDYWRLAEFIEQTESFEGIESQHHMEQTGFALGHFHHIFNDLPSHTLFDTLPGFHITPLYLKRYIELSNTTKSKKIPAGIDAFIDNHQHLSDKLEKAKNAGLLKKRVIHGDPKLNNVLFDYISGEAISIIDLDTVKSGLIHYDIGDCLRSCCNNVCEDQQMAFFEIDVCEIILKSYLSETRAIFSQADFLHLYDAIILIPFELGLRFATDYLENNRYFKVSSPEQNLIRARNQFQLVASIEKQQQKILKLIHSLK